MNSVTISLFSRESHLSQILTGFQLLSKGELLKIAVELCPDSWGGAFVQVKYRGRTLIYDMLDGYNMPEAIKARLDSCDFYFKRSFSEEKNRQLGLQWQGKIYPLGFNYHVSCRNHPMDKPFWKEEIKKILGIENNMFSNTRFTSKLFEELPKFNQKPQVLFLTRLWDLVDPVTNQITEECRYINTMRIEIIRRLRAMEGDLHFVGGLPDSKLSHQWAPDLIMPQNLTYRRKYLGCMHKSDICIGTMGLHESIGWKTGEYVAAAKAIVNERFHYTVPGDFVPEKNYLEFETADQCIAAVESLIASPEKVYEMKCRNREYYLNYLRPDVLIRNTLDIVDRNL